MRAKHLEAAKAGERTDSAGKPIRNKILLCIPDAEYQRIRQQLEFVDLPNHLSLHETHKKQQFVYFLNRGLASIVVAMRGSRCGGLRRDCGRRSRCGLGQKSTPCGNANSRRRIQNFRSCFMCRSWRHSRLADAPESLCRLARDASGANRCLQSVARYQTTPCTLAADGPTPRPDCVAANHT